MKHEKAYIIATIIVLGMMIGTAVYAGTATTDKNQKDYLKALDKNNITKSDTAILVSSCQQNGATMIQTDKFIVISAKDNAADMGITEKDCKKLMKDVTKDAKRVE